MAKRQAKNARRSRAKASRAARLRARDAKPPSQRAIEAALAGITHDIRTPLTGIMALAELLASSHLGERERQWANALKSGAEHLAAMTTLIVDAAKAEATGLTLRHEPFSPRRLAETVGRAFAARAETKSIAADIAIDRELPAMVAGDEMRLRAALENLADNAAKFTDRGAVSFSVNSYPVGRQHVRLVFAVSDSGIGLSKSDISHLFRPFAQASEQVAQRYGGAGLGLVFVKRIAKAMDGDLTITSTKARGSTFRLSAVFERVDAPSEFMHDGVAHRTPVRPLNILCAEDNPYGRVVMNTILSELGHRADFVETGDAAIKALESNSYDAVLMDVTLGGLDGIEATRRIRAMPGKMALVPIIGVSGRTDPGNDRIARDAGMNFYFHKPVSPARLAQALATIAD
ncbi:MAG: ATP-binding protein [Pseudolabrys sp.]